MCVIDSLYVTVCVVCFAFGTELLILRFSSAPPSTEVTYEQLKRLLASDKAVVVDVREPWELREYGFIPGSINVPCECSRQNTQSVDVQGCSEQ